MCVYPPQRRCFNGHQPFSCSLTHIPGSVWLPSVLCSTSFQFVSVGTWLSGSNLQVIGDELELASSWFSFRWCFAELLSLGTAQNELSPHLSAPPQLQCGQHYFVFAECFLFFTVLSIWSHFTVSTSSWITHRVNQWVKKQRHRKMTFIYLWRQWLQVFKEIDFCQCLLHNHHVLT